MPASQKKYKVIILDDDDFLVDMYATKFGLSNVEVEAFKSGKAFLDSLAAGGEADLVLLDVVIPGMNGMEVLAEIRKQNLLPKTPVVMLTNQNDEKDITEAKRLGIAGYIVKAAATPTEVVEEVMKIIKSSK